MISTEDAKSIIGIPGDPVYGYGLLFTIKNKYEFSSVQIYISHSIDGNNSVIYARTFADSYNSKPSWRKILHGGIVNTKE